MIIRCKLVDWKYTVERKKEGFELFVFCFRIGNPNHGKCQVVWAENREVAEKVFRGKYGNEIGLFSYNEEQYASKEVWLKRFGHKPEIQLKPMLFQKKGEKENESEQT